MIVLAVVLAAIAAIGSGVGSKLQNSGVQAEGVGSLKRLGANRSWRLGLGVLGLSTVLQVLALTFAPVIVVAPLVVLALPVVAVLGKRLDQSAGIAVGAVAVSIAVFVALAAGTSTSTDLAPTAIFTATQLAVAAAAALVIVAVLSRGVLRCAALAAAAGASYGLVSVLVRDVAFSVRTEGLAGLPWLSLSGAVVAFAAAAWLVQLAHASGPPDLVVGCQTAVNPLVATTLGMTVLGESRHLEAATVIALAGCAVAAIAGIAVLTRHHLVATSARRRVRYSRST
ncbi:MAG TPA: hypothetical protein VHC18_28315 [Amycolatopsis sp.]|nr:hypothetical protein [Amycolatopsis sp.]